MSRQYTYFVITEQLAWIKHNLGFEKIHLLCDTIRAMKGAHARVDYNIIDQSVIAEGMFSEKEIKMLLDYGFTHYDPRKQTMEDIHQQQKLLVWAAYSERLRENTKNVKVEYKIC